MGITPVYKQLAEALDTYNSRARALENVVDLCPKEERSDHAFQNALQIPSRYRGTARDPANEPNHEEPAILPTLTSSGERAALAATCKSELQGLQTAIDILTQSLDEHEGKQAKHLLAFIEEEGLSSEALKLIVSRFTEKKKESDARFNRASGYFVALKQRSEAVVKAEITGDVVCVNTGIWPCELSLADHRHEVWMIHQARCHEVRAVMDREAEIGRQWTEKVERLEEMVERDIDHETRLRQVMTRNHSDYYLGADEYDSVSDDGRDGSEEGSVALESVIEVGDSVTSEDMRISEGAVVDEDQGTLLSATTVSTPVPADSAVAVTEYTEEAVEEGRGAKGLPRK